MAKKIKTLAGLWKVQYVPMEKRIKANLTPEALKKWNKQTMAQKIVVIDRLVAKNRIPGLDTSKM